MLQSVRISGTDEIPAAKNCQDKEERTFVTDIAFKSCYVIKVSVKYFHNGSLLVEYKHEGSNS
jgi:hypothetical protein